MTLAEKVLCKHNLLIFKSIESVFCFYPTFKGKKKWQQLVEISLCPDLETHFIGSQSQWQQTTETFTFSQCGQNTAATAVEKRASMLVYRPNESLLLCCFPFLFWLFTLEISIVQIRFLFCHHTCHVLSKQWALKTKQRRWCWGWLNIQQLRMNEEKMMLT